LPYICLYFLIKRTVHFHSVPRTGIGVPIHTRALPFIFYKYLKISDYKRDFLITMSDNFVTHK
jgi:hypothetical protein